VMAEGAHGSGYFKRSNCFHRVHVLIAHEPTRLISANRQKCNIDSPMAFAHLMKYRALAKARITDAVDFLASAGDHEARPKRVHAVTGSAGGPVLRRHHMDGQPRCKHDRVTPVNGRGRDAPYATCQDLIIAERRYDAWPKTLPKPANGLNVH